ncbi:hypothetical protein [Sulfoacidibacillus ferrooxidans]|uniref:Uncharacterized protein n=1 Tax=Sulfoacidibacillus ferrooxidans TaxID=2005001 RepID=A0A9X2ACZ3_9BACL|nr:hypothetical protein [Sulfoacidibacillus ferrooxidans]MCI0184688.1 hypothetical protein [Sulfoacidibacillus ferrooxidans]
MWRNIKRLVTHSMKLISQFDDNVLNYLRLRVTLMAALLGVVFLLFSFIEHNVFSSIEVLLAGAVGYSIGFVPAVFGGILITALSIMENGGHHEHWAPIILQFLGCSVIAWLGHSHQLATQHTREQNKIPAQRTIRAQIVPWALVNEVRNSLLGMRLLIFTNTMDRDAEQRNLQIVETELLRLEALFNDLSEEEVNAEHLAK